MILGVVSSCRIATYVFVHKSLQLHIKVLIWMFKGPTYPALCMGLSVSPTPRPRMEMFHMYDINSNEIKSNLVSTILY